jgi:hypothetical protein
MRAERRVRRRLSADALREHWKVSPEENERASRKLYRAIEVERSKLLLRGGERGG